MRRNLGRDAGSLRNVTIYSNASHHSLPEYQPMAIEHRAAVIHLPDNTFLTLRTLFGLIWTTTVSELRIFVAVTIYIRNISLSNDS